MRQRHLGFLAVCLSAVVSHAHGIAEEPLSGRQVGQQFTSPRDKSLTSRYLLFLPKGYQPRGATPGKKTWPLLMFLHGSGERGANLELVKKHGPPKIVEKKADFPFVVISPQCPTGKRFAPRVLTALLDDVQHRHNVDSRRIYVTGLSMGGAGTWDLANADPKRLAAIVPICGTSEIDQSRFRTLPIWAAVGGKDRPSLVGGLQQTVAQLREQGTPIRFTIYPQLGHNCWDAMYDDPALYKWLLGHTSAPKQPSK